MNCEECGKQILSEMKFCSNCGNKIESQSTETTKRSKSHHKGLIILVCILLIIITGAVVYALVISPNTKQKALENCITERTAQYKWSVTSGLSDYLDYCYKTYK